MPQTRSVTEWLAERGLTLSAIVEASALDRRVVEAIAAGRYTPSPEQRRAVAAALGVAVDDVAWGHHTAVSHVYGHGPQFGRSP